MAVTITFRCRQCGAVFDEALPWRPTHRTQIACDCGGDADAAGDGDDELAVR